MTDDPRARMPHLVRTEGPPPMVDERYPRPDLVRDGWTDLCGLWTFSYDDDDRGLQERWQHRALPGSRDILVPFPPESSLSGIGDQSQHPVVWYRRVVWLDEEVGAPTDGERLVLHFGAVDYQASVWIDGQHVGGHEGGHTSFSVDITDALQASSLSLTVVVRVEDRVEDAAQPRGKQTWLSQPAGLFHPRTTGIWQPVWLERRPAVAVARLTWTPDVPGARVRLTAHLTTVPRGPVHLLVTLRLADEVLAEQSIRITGSSVTCDIALSAAADGRQLPRLLWSPARPTLLDADVRLLDGDVVLDHVRSYVGFRSVGVADGLFLLNGRPCPVRAVLAQGFWPESHLAAPSASALREEVELIKELGFNGVRVHQKIEDPRFLYWCDRLGLLVWAELPSAFAFTSVAARRLTGEWLEVLERDASHPSIVTWVVLNESWGVPHASEVPAQRDLARALTALTRAVDPSRPVISNDGWEHVDSDIITIHDYSSDPEQLLDRYADRDRVDQLVRHGRPWRSRIRFAGHREAGQPVMLSEFGGISWAPLDEPDAWGYTCAQDAEQYLEQLAALFGAVRAARSLAGFCYTQLTDTATETNGLLDGARRPKLPLPQLRAVITGHGRTTSGMARPVELLRTTGSCVDDVATGTPRA